MKAKKPLNLRMQKTWRLIFRIFFAVVAFVLPVVIISLKFKLFTEFSGIKITAVGLILIIVVLWRLKSKLTEWINSWEYSVLKYILIGFSRIYIFLIVLAILILAKQGLDAFIFCVEWLCICECIAYLIIYPAEQYFDNNVKRIIRGNERKEDYKEAIKELQQGTHK